MGALGTIYGVEDAAAGDGGWKWPALQFGYMLALALGGAWLVNWLV